MPFKEGMMRSYEIVERFKTGHGEYGGGVVWPEKIQAGTAKAACAVAKGKFEECTPSDYNMEVGDVLHGRVEAYWEDEETGENEYDFLDVSKTCEEKRASG